MKREGQMGTYITVAKDVYLAALEEDWDRMIRACSGIGEMYVMSPVTVSEDTPLHLAVYSKEVQPLKALLDIADKNPIPGNPFTKKNAYGNTVLHEAVFAGNMEAVEHLLNYDPSMQLQTKNKLGETPLYRAAACGKKKIVERLFSEGKLLEDHRKRGDSNPILHAAIQGQHFDTALTLLEKDPSLYEMKDSLGMTCLHVLAGMPSAFKSGQALRPITITNLFYRCLSAAKGDGDQSRSKKGWPVVERIQKDKHKHESALKLAQELIKKNQLKWWQSIKVNPTKVNIETPGQGGRGGQSERQGGGGIPGGGREGQEGAREGADTGRGGGGEVENNENVQPKIEENRIQERPPSPPNPLFIATSHGIVEIAEEILDNFPQGIELVNDEGQNILHVAVMHRRREIFRLVKKKNIIVTRMSSSVDNNGFTLLHQVAHVKHYSGGAKPGPALQLQEEIKWFKRVQKVVPPSLSEQKVKWVLSNDKLMTAIELFQEEHKGQLKLAQDWIEKTSQSCSAVAVLLATVVFAAAYTIPGGSNDRGFPIFLHNRFFIAFTVLDVTALASSLTSVVMFLSILTTPFECEKFHHSIPRKLICGFTLLFFSVMTTMLAFSCTLLLVIRLKKQWTTGLMSIAAFLPVSVFAVMQFPLYVAFMTTMKDFYKEVVKSLPWCQLPFRYCFRQGKARRR